MHAAYPKVGDPIQSFINVCGDPQPESTNEMVVFVVPGVNANLTCWVDEHKHVQKLASSIPMGMQAGIELAKRFLPEGAQPAEAHLDTESAKINENVQTFVFKKNGIDGQAEITADEVGAFSVALK